jgi:hypothetical protein
MKKLLRLFLLNFCFIGLSIANSENTDNVKDITIKNISTIAGCTEVSKIAAETMKYRQDGLSVAEVFAINDKRQNKILETFLIGKLNNGDFEDLIDLIASGAYSEKWRRDIDAFSQENTILDFSNEFFLDCYNQFKNK